MHFCLCRRSQTLSCQPLDVPSFLKIAVLLELYYKKVRSNVLKVHKRSISEADASTTTFNMHARRRHSEAECTALFRSVSLCMCCMINRLILCRFSGVQMK